MSTIPVEIVRPEKTGSERFSEFVSGRFSEFVSGLMIFFLCTWIVMLALGALTPWHLGYWESMLALLGIRAAQKPDSWMSWTRKSR